MSAAFECARCGCCCRWAGYVYVSGEDARGLARKLRMRERAFLDRYTRLAPNRAELVLAERPDGACIFLRGNLCRVYTSRPRQCREFPVAWRVDGPCRDGARERIALGGPGSEPT